MAKKANTESLRHEVRREGPEWRKLDSPRRRRRRVEKPKAAKKTRAKPRKTKDHWDHLCRFDGLPDVEAASIAAARDLATASWRMPSGGPYPDGGWAMVRGCAITLAYDAWSRARGMRGISLARAFPENADAIKCALGRFEALPLADLTPDHFGHVHETLVEYAIRDGAVVPAGGRRRMGAHFTPPGVARSVVRTTVKPLLRHLVKEHGRDDLGERILDLRICDPAVGAGAFLLALVRILGPMVKHGLGLATLEDAKRLVAINVAYGVDKDRYAVYAAKLALTLECRADGMPDDWLDDTIKVGDALVGLDREQVTRFAWPSKRRQAEVIPEFDELWTQAVTSAAHQRLARMKRFAAISGML